DPPFVSFDMKPAAIEELTPDPSTVHEVVPEEVSRRCAQERLARGTVLLEQRVVELRDPLMREDVVERFLLVDRVVPHDRLIQHHEEKAIQRLREEQLQTIVGFHGVLSREDLWRKPRPSFARFSIPLNRQRPCRILPQRSSFCARRPPCRKRSSVP